MYLYGGGIDFVSFYNFSIGCWNCSDSVVFCFSNYYFPKVGDKLPFMIKKQVKRIISFERLFMMFSFHIVLYFQNIHVLEICRYFFIVHISINVLIQGRIQDFKLVGWGGAHLKKSSRAEGGAKIVGVFHVKNHDFTQKNHIFFPILGGGWCRVPW